MNERIKELAEQAREYATTRHPGSNIILFVDLNKFEKKFAELLIKECVDFVNYYNTRNEPITPQHITRHFGVEE